MICDQCGGATRVMETREADYFTLRRRRECTTCGERFNTYEMRERILPSATDALRRAAAAVQNRLDRNAMCIQMANRLHEGPRVLAAELGVHQKTVEKMARKGRDHLKRVRLKRV